MLETDVVMFTVAGAQTAVGFVTVKVGISIIVVVFEVVVDKHP